jgi:magnesium transporter
MNVRAIHTKNLKWIDIVSPGAAELEFLKKNYSFHPLDLQDVVATSQHTKVEHRDTYEFVVMLFPVFDRKAREIKPAEVDFFIGKGYLITIHDGSMFTMTDMVAGTIEHEELRRELMSQNSGWLMYQVLERLFKRSFPILDHMSFDMDEIEHVIFKDLSVKTLEAISLMKRNIIDFRRITKTHHLILKKLMLSKEPYVTFPDSRDYYASLLDHAENIWDILAIQKETADALQEANQALAANRLNKITEIFTIASAVFLPATFVVLAFSLSVAGIPLAANPHAFWLVLGIAVVCSGGMFWVFKKKRFF